MQLALASEPVRVAIVGSRKFPLLPMVDDVVQAIGAVRVVSGGARGVDLRGEKAARRLGYPEPLIFKPKWKRANGETNLSAGKERNTVIVENSDVVIAFWDGKSRGTKDTIVKAWKKGLPVLVFIYQGNSLRVKAENFYGAESELRKAAEESAKRAAFGHAEAQGQRDRERSSRRS